MYGLQSTTSVSLLETTTALFAEEGIDAEYRDVGHVSLALGEQALAEHQATVAALHADGFPASLLDRQQLGEFCTTPLAGEISGGLFLPNSGTVHSARLVQGIAAVAQRHGACFLTNTPVEELHPLPGGGLRLTTNRGTVKAPRGVVALNAWTSEQIPVLRGLITPVRGQALSFAPMPPVFRAGFGAALTPTGEYWHQTADGTIILGGCRASAPGGDVGIVQQEPSEPVQQAIAGVLPRLFPQLAPAPIQCAWAGLMAFTPDHTPIIDRVPGFEGVWMSGGFSGHGMPFGLRLGRALAESLLGGQASPLLSPFRRERPSLRMA